MPLLTREFAAVWAPSAQAATRFARQLKAGEPARLLADLAFANPIVFHAPSANVDFLVEIAAQSLKWEGRVALVWDDVLDSGALAALAGRGALTASVALAPDTETPLAVLEGDARAVRMARRWLASAAVPSVILVRGGKRRFLASWAVASACLIPLLEGVAEGLQSAGLTADRARRLASRWIDTSVRRYTYHGRTASKLRRNLRDQTLRLEWRKLSGLHPDLMRRYESVLDAVAELLTRPWFAGISNEPLESL